jgi:hypothetical protein
MKQVISRESGPRSVQTGKRNIHLLPGQPAFVDDDEAIAIQDSGVKVQVMDIRSGKQAAPKPKLVPEATGNDASEPDHPDPVVVDDGIHSCPFCPEDSPREFDTPQGLASHIRAKHPDEYQEWKESRDSD